MMEWLKYLFGKKKTGDFPVAWDVTRTSIYSWLSPWVENDKPLPESMQILPDEPNANDNEIRWGAGALDGICVSHFGGAQDRDLVTPIVAAFTDALNNTNKKSVKHLYDLLNEDSPIVYLDDLLITLAKAPDIPAGRLFELVEWLVKNSPDRNVVKVAIALLAYFPGEQSKHHIKVFGGHDEFTLYAVVALKSISTDEDYEQLWLHMAKRVEGWGRVHMINRLPENMTLQIRHWLLRTGYNNAVMPEYTAWHCATAGQLLIALVEEEHDAELLAGASEILQALINGGPDKCIDDYADAPQTCRRYLEVVVNQQPDALSHYITAREIYQLAQNKADDSSWGSEECEKISMLAKNVMDNPRWDGVMELAWHSDNRVDVYLAAEISRARGQNPHRYLLQRQSRYPLEDNWYQLMQTQDPEEACEIATLFEQQFDLKAIGTGAGESVGIGMEYRPHRALDSILQELTRFPGVGATLLLTGLQSPVIRNRQMALNALEKWPEQVWPSEAYLLMKEGAISDPYDGIRERLCLWVYKS